MSEKVKNIISIEFPTEKNGSHVSSRRCHELLFLDDKHLFFACFKLSPMILRIVQGENLHSHTTAPSLEVRIQRKTSFSVTSGVMKFKGPTGRIFFCIDLLHDEKLPLKRKKFPVSCQSIFLPIHQLTKSFITAHNCCCSTSLKSNTAIKRREEDYLAFKCNMNREDSFFENNFPFFFISSPLASILLFDFFSDVSRIAARCSKINCYCSHIKSQISIFNARAEAKTLAFVFEA